MAARRDGFDPSYAIDLVLDVVARDFRKPVVSLETPEAQIQSLRSPDQDLIEFVRSALDDLESGRDRPLLVRMANAWTSSDYDELANYAKWCDCLRTPADRAAMKRLLDDRNPALAAAIDALHASGKQVFAAVGSLHMVGPMGLPALMRQRGYKVEQGDFPH
ncbi:MAG: TraB/GumN family protein, partial [Pseudomonadota bacterium]|nr:TraB/GumN family protein [Pseudomonadota bacterium]